MPKLQAATGLWERFTGYLTHSKSKFPNHEEAQLNALCEYLSKFRANLIECAIMDDSNLSQCVKNTLLVYDQLHSQKIFHGDPSEHGSDVTLANNLHKVILDSSLKIHFFEGCSSCLLRLYAFKGH